jgi:hypothetical protein
MTPALMVEVDEFSGARGAREIDGARYCMVNCRTFATI